MIERFWLELEATFCFCCMLVVVPKDGNNYDDSDQMIQRQMLSIMAPFTAPPYALLG